MTELPARVRAVCGTFLDAVPDGLVSGLYLRGGLAFGEWVDGKSDIDFTATLRRAPTTKDIDALRRAHEVVGSEWGPVPHFDGVHLLAIDLAEPPDACPDRPVVHMREFSDTGRFDLTPVPWHELARHGVTVVGPPVETLEVWTDDVVLRAFTSEVVTSASSRRMSSSRGRRCGSASVSRLAALAPQPAASIAVVEEGALARLEIP